MYRLPAPTTPSADAYNAAVKTIKQADRRTLFTNAAPTVQARCNAFDRLAADLKFDDADSINFEVAGLGTQTMSGLYDEQFTKRVGTKAIRDSIKNAAPLKLCPYCGEGSTTQLDHYLPKKEFEGTTVHPANLVPVCADCNFAKLDYAPGVAAPAVLHPYFDTAFDTAWLSAKLERGDLGLPVINFKVSLARPDPRLEARLNAHMRVFNLWHRFSVWAAQSLDNFERFIQTEHGPAMSLLEARNHLRRTGAQESGGRINSWERATYNAMLKNDWYLTLYLKLT